MEYLLGQAYGTHETDRQAMLVGVSDRETGTAQVLEDGIMRCRAGRERCLELHSREIAMVVRRSRARDILNIAFEHIRIAQVQRYGQSEDLMGISRAIQLTMRQHCWSCTC